MASPSPHLDEHQTTIREGSAGDLDQLALLGLRFIQNTIYASRLPNTLDHARRVAEVVLAHGHVLVAERDQRLIAAIAIIVVPHFVLGETVANEIIWWADPEARGRGAALRLFKVAERWARDQGATLMQFGAYRDARLERLYEHLGYRAQEVIYEKRL